MFAGGAAARLVAGAGLVAAAPLAATAFATLADGDDAAAAGRARRGALASAVSRRAGPGGDARRARRDARVRAPRGGVALRRAGRGVERGGSAGNSTPVGGDRAGVVWWCGLLVVCKCHAPRPGPGAVGRRRRRGSATRRPVTSSAHVGGVRPPPRPAGDAFLFRAGRTKKARAPSKHRRGPLRVGAVAFLASAVAAATTRRAAWRRSRPWRRSRSSGVRSICGLVTPPVRLLCSERMARASAASAARGSSAASGRPPTRARIDGARPGQPGAQGVGFAGAGVEQAATRSARASRPQIQPERRDAAAAPAVDDRAQPQCGAPRKERITQLARDLQLGRVERRPADGASQRFQQCVERQHELHGRARGQEGDGPPRPALPARGGGKRDIGASRRSVLSSGPRSIELALLHDALSTSQADFVNTATTAAQLAFCSIAAIAPGLRSSTLENSSLRSYRPLVARMLVSYCR